MSENDTAERPEMTDDEKEQLKELKAKEAAEAKAVAEEAAAEAEAKRELELEEIANRPLYHVLVRHMGRSPRTRTMRAARAGHRRQGMLLDDGTRIRKKGRGRYTEVDLRTLVANHQKFLEYVRVGQAEVCDPKTERPIPYGDLVDMIVDLGNDMAGQAKELTAAYDEAMEEYAEAVEAYPDEMADYAEEMKDWDEAAAKAAKADKEPPEKPELPVKPLQPNPPPPWAKDFKLDLTSVQADPVRGSNTMNAAPDDDSAPPTVGEDATRDVSGESAVLAAVDQHEAEMRGEANTPDGETGLLADDGTDAGGEASGESAEGDAGDAEGDAAGEGEESSDGEEGSDGDADKEEGYSEEKMLEMGLDDLKKLAVKEFDIAKKAVKKLRAKKEVVALIMEAGNVSKGEE